MAAIARSPTLVTFYDVFQPRYSSTTAGAKDIAKLIKHAFDWLRYFDFPMANKLTKIADVSSKAKSFVGLCDLYKKTDELFKVFQGKGKSGDSVHVWKGRERSSLNSAVNTLGKMGECGVHFNEVVDLFRSVDLLTLTKEGVRQLKWFSTGSTLVKGLTGLYVEVVKSSVDEVSFKRTAVERQSQQNDPVVVTRNTTQELLRAKGFCDWVSTALKVAMNVSLVVIASVGFAGLMDCVVPLSSLIILSCSTIVTITGIVDHFMANVCIENLNRLA